MGQKMLMGYGFLFLVFHILNLTLYPLDPFIFLSIHIFLLCFLVFLTVPAREGSPSDSLAKTDIILACLSATIPVYISITYQDLYYRIGFEPTPWDLVFGVLQLVLLIEAARRLSGWVMPIICLVFIAYAVFGDILPGTLGHRGYPWERVVSSLFSTEGIYGVACYVSASFIVLFVAFGTFLNLTGGGDFFTRLAASLLGNVRGGAAKVSVVSSALYGTISGSAVANVVVDGMVTIPMMKRSGFKGAFAAGVEAAASTGGQMMPPVMGSVAFVMAEMTMTSYREVIVAAFIPSIFYYFCLFWAVDFESYRQKIKTLSREELPRVWTVLREDAYLLIPLFLLIYMIVIMNRTPIFSAIFVIVLTIGLSWLKRERRMGFKKFFEACRESVQGTLEVGVICGMAGIIVGIFALTGVGGRMAGMILNLAGGNLFIALFLVMVVTLILGMGMPTVPAYIIAASVGTPVMVKLGTPVMAAHLFVLFFACISTITPPVALAAYAAAGLAKADFWETGWNAFRLGIGGFVVPFMFVYHPFLLYTGPLSEILIGSLICSVGMVSLAGALYLPIRWWERGILVFSTYLLIAPGLVTDILGAGIGLGFFAARYYVGPLLSRRRAAREALQTRNGV
jgi:TRAP transporter 4TM/12TM fusion protein